MREIKNINQIRVLYDAAKEADKALFSEMRTNVKLRNGDHYNTAVKRMMGTFRDAKVITNEQKIRITKNHIYRITDEHINAITSRNPSVTCVPYNDAELSDIKDAELSNSVLKYIKDENDWDELRDDFIHEQVVIGEAYAVLSFDYSKGEILEDGTCNGRINIEKKFGFDVKRDPDAKTFNDCRYVFIDKVVDKEDAKELVKKYRPDKVTALVDAQDSDTITVFDTNTGRYIQESAKVAMREMFIRPCTTYPNGKYILSTKHFIVLQMDLPLGIFPVYQLGFSKITTTPRCSSVTRIARPYQVEINRASSKMAEHQITIGDDKIIVRNGSKVSNGGKLSGIRVVNVDGLEPTVMAGRTGAQYLDYVNSELAGMYKACGTDHLLQDKNVQVDPLTALKQMISQKAMFNIYIKQYETFEKKLFKDAIKMAKHYLNDSHIVKIIGKKEQVNIAEFRDSDGGGYDISVEASNGDIETKFGKMVMTSHILQYAGSSMNPEQLGQLIKNLPYGNNEQVFSTLTLDYDTASNMILALDRGEMPAIPVYGNTDFYLKALTSRTVKADFKYLEPQVQQGYSQSIQQLNQIKSGQLLQAQQAAQGMIPASGFLTTVNQSWKNPVTNKVERIKVPSDSMAWLVQKLNQQGTFVQELQSQSPQVQSEVAAGASQMQQQMAQQMPVNPNVPQAQGAMQ